jgi:hypothetical protein
MKDFLQDLLAHTHALGSISLVKILGTTKETKIQTVSDDGRSVILFAETHNAIDGIEETFGMPNLGKLDYYLKCPEYKEGAGISLFKETKDGVDIPKGLHFQNSLGDFENDFRFMSAEVINEKIKVKSKSTPSWDIEFKPTVGSIQRLKFQAGAFSEEPLFQVKTDGTDLVFSWGDANSHSGSFVFHQGVTAKLKNSWTWPAAQVIGILNLSGDVTMKIADAGLLQITVDSGIAIYNYILPAWGK